MAIRRKRNKRIKDEIDKLYDSMKVKDMTREDFRAAYLRAVNPRRMRQDLMAVVLQRQNGQTNKLAIERGLERGRIP